MEKSTNNKLIFPFKLSKLIIALSIVCQVLCVAGIVITTLRIVDNGGLHNPMDYLKYPFLIAICLFCIVVVISILIQSRYVIDNTTLTTQFGIVKSKYDITSFTSLTVDTQANKITVNQGEEFFVLSVNKDWQAEFVQAIVAQKSSIDVSYILTDDQHKEKKKKDKK